MLRESWHQIATHLKQFIDIDSNHNIFFSAKLYKQKSKKASRAIVFGVEKKTLLYFPQGKREKRVDDTASGLWGVRFSQLLEDVASILTSGKVRVESNNQVFFERKRSSFNEPVQRWSISFSCFFEPFQYHSTNQRVDRRSQSCDRCPTQDLDPCQTVSMWSLSDCVNASRKDFIKTACTEISTKSLPIHY